jgi:pyruvate dehydrogenase E1 component beta subunit
MSEKELSIAEAINEGLDEKLEENEDVVLIGEDIGENGGVFRVTEDLYEKYGSDRVMDSPLAESGIVGSSIGMAFKDIKPVAEIQFMGFLYPALDQIFSHVSRYRSRTRSDYVPDITIRVPYGGGIGAPEHHSESTEAILSHYPGVKVVIPSNPKNAKGLIKRSIECNDPVVFLEPKRIYRSFKEPVPEEDYTEWLHSSRITETGDDVTVISWGSMHRMIEENYDKFDYDVELIDLRSIQPIYTETILKSVKKTGRCVIVQEAPSSCSVSSEITARIQEEALEYQEAPVQRITGMDVPYPLEKLEDYYLPNMDRVKKKIDRVMNYEF